MEPDARSDPAPEAPTAADATPAPADPAEAIAADLRQAAGELDGLADRPLEDHVAVYERLHARMHTALRTVEE